MKKLLLLLFLLGGSPAWAAVCPEHFYLGATPVFEQASLTEQSTLLCNQGYAVFYSGKTKTPLWAAEYLTPLRMGKAQHMARVNYFKEDRRLGTAVRATLPDYVHSGLDRGHLAPAGDMTNAVEQQQSFLLSNVVPQAPNINRGAWAQLEEFVRDEARTRSLYVVTGVLFEGKQVAFLQGRVGVPTHLYKTLYDPATGEAEAFVIANRPRAPLQRVPVATINARAHIKFGWPLCLSPPCEHSCPRPGLPPKPHKPPQERKHATHP